MKKTFLLIFLLLSSAACAADITFQWDASITPSLPENPILYSIYVCTDAALTQCANNNAGQSLTLIVRLNSGVYWVYATARNYAVVSDGIPQGPIQESDKSNILAFRIQVPPGNPGNVKIRIN